MRFAVILTLAVLAGPARADDWKLVWSDEFSKDGRPDPSKWDYEVGFVRNNEAQYYTRDDAKNARVENGRLIIEARKERLADLPGPARKRGGAAGRTTADYTSASLTTQGKAAWTEGRIEVKAKLPTGRGSWPAIWTLGTNIDQVGWPRCGEIDIMENVGFDPDLIHANVHTQYPNQPRRSDKGAQITIPKPYADFHVYAVEWDTKVMTFSVDGKTYFTYENEGSGADTWPYNKPQYLILNIAIGGAWGGQKGIDDAIFPQTMEIDYVRVYQKAETPR
jgi:beta-glucanase (GH16 family)